MGGKIIPKIRLTSAKDLVEVEAELGKKKQDLCFDKKINIFSNFEKKLVEI